MKKRFCSVIVAFMLLFLGCVSASGSKIEKMEDGSTLEISERGVFASVKSIPWTHIVYNESNFELKSIDCYLEKSDSGFGYYPLVVVQYDLSALSDQDFYWLLNDQKDTYVLHVFDSKVYVDSKANNLDFSSLSEYKYLDGRILTCIYFDIEEYKYDFSDADISLFLTIRQDETYQFEDSDLNKENVYFFSFGPSDKDIPAEWKNESDIPEDVQIGLQKGLLNQLEFWSKLGN